MFHVLYIFWFQELTIILHFWVCPILHIYNYHVCLSWSLLDEFSASCLVNFWYYSIIPAFVANIYSPVDSTREQYLIVKILKQQFDNNPESRDIHIYLKQCFKLFPDWIIVFFPSPFLWHIMCLLNNKRHCPLWIKDLKLVSHSSPTYSSHCPKDSSIPE